MKGRRSKSFTFVVGAVLMLGVAGTLVYFMTRGLPAFVAISWAAILAGAFGYPLYAQGRIYLGGADEQIWTQKMEDAFEKRVFVQALFSVFYVFVVLISIPLVGVAFALNWGFTKLRPLAPSWLSDAWPSITQMIQWLIVIFTCLLSFGVVRWMWKQQYGDSNKGKMANVGSDG